VSDEVVLSKFKDYINAKDKSTIMNKPVPRKKTWWQKLMGGGK
jgi:hypothetical protein